VKGPCRRRRRIRSSKHAIGLLLVDARSGAPVAVAHDLELAAGLLDHHARDVRGAGFARAERCGPGRRRARTPARPRARRARRRRRDLAHAQHQEQRALPRLGQDRVLRSCHGCSW